MNIRIQDDVIRRALGFFGLRGVIPHDYESTILPVVSVGDLGQRTTYISSGTVAINVQDPIWTVPRGETWRLIQAAGTIAQSGGTVANTLRFATSLFSAGLGRMFFPFWFSTGEPEIQTAMGLNSTQAWVVQFWGDIYLSEGQSLEWFQSTIGDGLTETQTGAILLVQKINEVLVELE